MCSGQTGHAEIVEVEYDPEQITFVELLNVFFDLHNPTLDLRHHRGGQYRSALFYTTPDQEKAAIAAIKKLGPVTTQLAPAPKFWRAEEYHQRYYEKAKGAATCR